MKPAYLTTAPTTHFAAGVARLLAYDTPYTIGTAILTLARTFHAIEDFTLDDCFSLRPFLACDKEIGAVHIKLLHVHFVIQLRGYLDEFERHLQTDRPDEPPYSGE